MSDNENSFAHDGVEYVAVDDGERDYCSKCDLQPSGICHAAPFCTKNHRKDGREVIFKKKVTLEME